jgi:hypothetical protein
LARKGTSGKTAGVALFRSVAPQRAEVDAKRLAFLIEMAALQAERFGSVGHALAVPLQLSQDLVALEAIHALG